MLKEVIVSYEEHITFPDKSYAPTCQGESDLFVECLCCYVLR